jgi:uncharacterized protein (TIGR02271 family)
MTRTAVGYFHDRAAADAAYDDLMKNGFSRDEISIMGRGREGGAGLADDHDGDHVGAGEGAAVGGITGLLLGAAAMLIPGIGPIVAVGPLAAGLAGAVTGGVTGAVVGGVVGALEDAGVDHDTASYYDERFKKGGYLLTVRANDMEYDKARMILERHDGDVRAGTMPGTTAAATMPAARTATTGRVDTTDTDRNMQLKEERLRAEKENVKAGEVSLRKDVVTEQKSMDVPVTHEEVVVERRPVEGRRPATGDIREGETIRVPVHEEKVRLEKQAVVTEEVSVGKRPVTETERVSGTVRREEARVDTTGDVDVRGAAGTTPSVRGATPAAHEHRWVSGTCECGERKV